MNAGVAMLCEVDRRAVWSEVCTIFFQFIWCFASIKLQAGIQIENTVMLSTEPVLLRLMDSWNCLRPSCNDTDGDMGWIYIICRGEELGIISLRRI
jgi:hypothetical protein